MKLERAQELYSDYAEGALTPALKLALEQHFEADAAARADYDQFARVYSLLEQPAMQELEAPLGFRAKILERASLEQAKRESTLTQRATNTFAGWFSAVPHRRATGGALAALAMVVLLGVVLFPRPQIVPTGPRPEVTCLYGPCGSTSVTPEMIQNVDTQVGQDNNNYHQFHLHLPATIPAATVNAYVVTATEQITDPAHLGEATPALKDQHLTNHQGVAIPIAAGAGAPGRKHAEPAGSVDAGRSQVDARLGSGLYAVRRGQSGDSGSQRCQFPGRDAGGGVALRRDCRSGSRLGSDPDGDGGLLHRRCVRAARDNGENGRLCAPSSAEQHLLRLRSTAAALRERDAVSGVPFFFAPIF